MGGEGVVMPCEQGKFGTDQVGHDSMRIGRDEEQGQISEEGQVYSAWPVSALADNVRYSYCTTCLRLLRTSADGKRRVYSDSGIEHSPVSEKVRRPRLAAQPAIQDPQYPSGTHSQLFLSP